MNDELVVRPVIHESWSDLEALFESRGGPKACWCMAWRAMPNRAGASSADRKAALHQQVRDGVPIGLLGYLGGAAVAWCSVAPRETFRPLTDGQEGEPAGVWSVVCFFVRREHRGRGLTRQMLEAAVTLARTNGARVVEGYPVDADSPSYRFMGFTPLFDLGGFEPAGKAGSRRHVRRRAL